MRRIFLAALLALAAIPGQAADSGAPLNAGDEPSVTREHSIRLSRGELAYETVAGRLALRNDESDEPRAHMFYVAYSATDNAKRDRPLTFIWGGGPGGDSIALQHELMGPRIIEQEGLADNPDTLLAETDLVFVDAVGTGFSRAAKPEYAPQFYSMGGDIAAMSEFIRSYLALHGDARRPIYVGGQSLGTWRAAGVAEKLATTGYNLQGILIISGQVPGAYVSFAFDDAMYIPNRTEAALFHGKLDPELQRDPNGTIAAAREWARNVYWPALERKKKLTSAEREMIARQLARFTGVEEKLIDRRRLTMTTNVYRRTLVGSDPASELSISDLTVKGPRMQSVTLRAALGNYFRSELGYGTGLSYIASGSAIEQSFLPSPSAKPHRPGDWVWDEPQMSPEEMQRLEEGHAPANAPPWIQNALRANGATRVFVAAGRVDAMVSCLGNELMIARLEPALGRRYTSRCYYGGHSMYRGRPETRAALLVDLKAFIREGKAR